jgi:hypothetical protein
MARADTPIPAERHVNLPRRPQQADRWIAATAWLLAWIVAAAMIAGVEYSSRDPDSRLYTGISAHLVDEPVDRWISPQWWGLWGLTGAYTEHPVGMFVVPAALGRLGYPAPQAAYAINALYQVLSCALIGMLAAVVVPGRDARAVTWIVQLIPIAFVFRIRANQEYAVLLGLLLALYATERTRARGAWALGMLAGFAWVLLVKGVFAFIVPLTCGVWLLARGAADGPPGLQPGRSRVPLVAWTTVVAMPLVGLALVLLYESAYQHVTGRSFLELYRARQIPEGAITEGAPIWRAAYTLLWYTSRVIWFAFPWSLVSGAVLVTLFRARAWWPARVLTHQTDRESILRRQGAWFGIVAAAVLVFAFSAAHRKADRYIFPVYFLVAAVGGAAALARVPRLAQLADRLDRPWVPATVYVALFLLRLLTLGKLPEFTFWRS